MNEKKDPGKSSNDLERKWEEGGNLTDEEIRQVSPQPAKKVDYASRRNEMYQSLRSLTPKEDLHPLGITDGESLALVMTKDHSIAEAVIGTMVDEGFIHSDEIGDFIDYIGIGEKGSGKKIVSVEGENAEDAQVALGLKKPSDIDRYPVFSQVVDRLQYLLSGKARGMSGQSFDEFQKKEKSESEDQKAILEASSPIGLLSEQMETPVRFESLYVPGDDSAEEQLKAASAMSIEVNKDNVKKNFDKILSLLENPELSKQFIGDKTEPSMRHSEKGSAGDLTDTDEFHEKRGELATFVQQYAAFLSPGEKEEIIQRVFGSKIEPLLKDAMILGIDAASYDEEVNANALQNMWKEASKNSELKVTYDDGSIEIVKAQIPSLKWDSDPEWNYGKYLPNPAAILKTYGHSMTRIGLPGTLFQGAKALSSIVGPGYLTFGGKDPFKQMKHTSAITFGETKFQPLQAEQIKANALGKELENEASMSLGSNLAYITSAMVQAAAAKRAAKSGVAGAAPDIKTQLSSENILSRISNPYMDSKMFEAGSVMNQGMKFWKKPVLMATQIFKSGVEFEIANQMLYGGQMEGWEVGIGEEVAEQAVGYYITNKYLKGNIAKALATKRGWSMAVADRVASGLLSGTTTTLAEMSGEYAQSYAKYGVPPEFTDNFFAEIFTLGMFGSLGRGMAAHSPFIGELRQQILKEKLQKIEADIKNKFPEISDIDMKRLRTDIEGAFNDQISSDMTVEKQEALIKPLEIEGKKIANTIDNLESDLNGHLDFIDNALKNEAMSHDDVLSKNRIARMNQLREEIKANKDLYKQNVSDKEMASKGKVMKKLEEDAFLNRAVEKGKMLKQNLAMAESALSEAYWNDFNIAGNKKQQISELKKNVDTANQELSRFKKDYKEIQNAIRSKNSIIMETIEKLNDDYRAAAKKDQQAVIKIKEPSKKAQTVPKTIPKSAKGSKVDAKFKEPSAMPKGFKEPKIGVKESEFNLEFESRAAALGVSKEDIDYMGDLETSVAMADKYAGKNKSSVNISKTTITVPTKTKATEKKEAFKEPEGFDVDAMIRKADAFAKEQKKNKNDEKSSDTVDPSSMFSEDMKNSERILPGIDQKPSKIFESVSGAINHYLGRIDPKSDIAQKAVKMLKVLDSVVISVKAFETDYVPNAEGAKAVGVLRHNTAWIKNLNHFLLTGEIGISVAQRGDEAVLETLLHEAVHAVTLASLEYNPSFFTDASALMEEVNAYLNSSNYGITENIENKIFKNPHEFLAYFYADYGFQKILPDNLLDKIVKFIRKVLEFFGFDGPYSYKEHLQNRIDEMVESVKPNTDDASWIPANENAEYTELFRSEEMNMDEAESIDDIVDDIEYNIDKRLEQLIKNYEEVPKTLKQGILTMRDIYYDFESVRPEESAEVGKQLTKVYRFLMSKGILSGNQKMSSEFLESGKMAMAINEDPQIIDTIFDILYPDMEKTDPAKRTSSIDMWKRKISNKVSPPFITVDILRSIVTAVHPNNHSIGKVKNVLGKKANITQDKNYIWDIIYDPKNAVKTDKIRGMFVLNGDSGILANDYQDKTSDTTDLSLDQLEKMTRLLWHGTVTSRKFNENGEVTDTVEQSRMVYLPNSDKGSQYVFQFKKDVSFEEAIDVLVKLFKGSRYKDIFDMFKRSMELTPHQKLDENIVGPSIPVIKMNDFSLSDFDSSLEGTAIEEAADGSMFVLYDPKVPVEQDQGLFGKLYRATNFPFPHKYSVFHMDVNGEVDIIKSAIHAVSIESDLGKMLLERSGKRSVDEKALNSLIAMSSAVKRSNLLTEGVASEIPTKAFGVIQESKWSHDAANSEMGLSKQSINGMLPFNEPGRRFIQQLRGLTKDIHDRLFNNLTRPDERSRELFWSKLNGIHKNYGLAARLGFSPLHPALFSETSNILYKILYEKPLIKRTAITAKRLGKSVYLTLGLRQDRSGWDRSKVFEAAIPRSTADAMNLKNGDRVILTFTPMDKGRFSQFVMSVKISEDNKVGNVLQIHPLLAKIGGKDFDIDSANITIFKDPSMNENYFESVMEEQKDLFEALSGTSKQSVQDILSETEFSKFIEEFLPEFNIDERKALISKGIKEPVDLASITFFMGYGSSSIGLVAPMKSVLSFMFNYKQDPSAEETGKQKSYDHRDIRRTKNSDGTYSNLIGYIDLNERSIHNKSAESIHLFGNSVKVFTDRSPKPGKNMKRVFFNYTIPEASEASVRRAKKLTAFLLDMMVNDAKDPKAYFAVKQLIRKKASESNVDIKDALLTKFMSDKSMIRKLILSEALNKKLFTSSGISGEPNINYEVAVYYDAMKKIMLNVMNNRRVQAQRLMEVSDTISLARNYDTPITNMIGDMNTVMAKKITEGKSVNSAKHSPLDLFYPEDYRSSLFNLFSFRLYKARVESQWYGSELRMINQLSAMNRFLKETLGKERYLHFVNMHGQRYEVSLLEMIEELRNAQKRHINNKRSVTSYDDIERVMEDNFKIISNALRNNPLIDEYLFALYDVMMSPLKIQTGKNAFPNLDQHNATIPGLNDRYLSGDAVGSVEFKISMVIKSLYMANELNTVTGEMNQNPSYETNIKWLQSVANESNKVFETLDREGKGICSL